MGKTLETLGFMYYFSNFNKNWRWRDGLLYFIMELYKKVSKTLKHKLQAAVCIVLASF